MAAQILKSSWKLFERCEYYYDNQTYSDYIQIITTSLKVAPYKQKRHS